MNTASECFDKVKTDCFKFIKSQETSKEKFKGKEKMLKSFLIPACFWISNESNFNNFNFNTNLKFSSYGIRGSKL